MENFDNISDLSLGTGGGHPHFATHCSKLANAAAAWVININITAENKFRKKKTIKMAKNSKHFVDI